MHYFSMKTIIYLSNYHLISPPIISYKLIFFLNQWFKSIYPRINSSKLNYT